MRLALAVIVLALAACARQSGPPLGTNYIPASSGLTWTTALDCDFTAQTTQNLPDGTYTFCGQTWTKINSAKDHSAAHITNGTGLVIAPADDTTGSLWTNHTITALTVPLTSIVTGVDPSTPLRIWIYVASQTQAPSGGEEGVHVGVDDWSGSAYTWAWNETIGVTGAGTGLALRMSSSTCSTHESDDVSSLPTPPYVVTMTLQDGSGGRRAQQWRNGTYSLISGWPSLSGMVPAQNEDRGQLTFASGCITNYANVSAQTLILGAVGNVGWSGYDNYAVTIGRIRVDYRL